jgi:hypothetical protein
VDILISNLVAAAVVLGGGAVGIAVGVRLDRWRAS